MIQDPKLYSTYCDTITSLRRDRPVTMYGNKHLRNVMWRRTRLELRRFRRSTWRQTYTTKGDTFARQLQFVRRLTGLRSFTTLGLKQVAYLKKEKAKLYQTHPWIYWFIKSWLASPLV